MDILGGAQGVNYASDYRDFGGVMVPTTRRVFSYDAARRKIPGLPLVTPQASVGFIPFARLSRRERIFQSSAPTRSSPMRRDGSPIRLAHKIFLRSGIRAHR